MGFGSGRACDSRWVRHCIIAVGVVLLVAIGMPGAARGVAAAGATATVQSSPTAAPPTKSVVTLTPTAPPTQTATSAPSVTKTPTATSAATTKPSPSGTPALAGPPNPASPAPSPSAPPSTTTPAASAAPTSIAQPLQQTSSTATSSGASSTPAETKVTPTHPGGTQTPTASPSPTGTASPTPMANRTPDDLKSIVILEDPGIGGNATVARVALRHYGEILRPDGVPWAGWCEMFVDNVLVEAGVPQPRYPTAFLDAASGPLYRGRAPAGSLVFFDLRSSPDGHVGIALGDGTMLSALKDGIVRTTYESWPSYLGWRPYGTTSPRDEPFLIGALIAPPAHEVPQAPAVPDPQGGPAWFPPVPEDGNDR